MKFFQVLGLSVCMFACASCTTKSNQADTQVNTSSSVASSSIAPLTAMQKLEKIQLPNEWKSLSDSYNVSFALPSVFANIKDSTTDHDLFYVHALTPEACTKEYADSEARGSGPASEAMRFSGGYTWEGFDGAGFTKNDPPDKKFWCIHHAEQGMDVLVTAFKADTNTIKFVESSFIPLWLASK